MLIYATFNANICHIQCLYMPHSMLIYAPICIVISSQALHAIYHHVVKKKESLHLKLIEELQMAMYLKV